VFEKLNDPMGFLGRHSRRRFRAALRALAGTGRSANRDRRNSFECKKDAALKAAEDDGPGRAGGGHIFGTHDMPSGLTSSELRCHEPSSTLRLTLISARQARAMVAKGKSRLPSLSNLINLLHSFAK